MQNLFVVTAKDLIEWLDKEIAEGRNPKTPAEWEDCMKRLVKAKKAQYLGSTDKSSGYIAGSLRDEGINAKVVKFKKEPKDEQ
jgi:hypothetical protein